MKKTCRVIGLGEILWDLLPGGKQLGGAPANFAYHAHALGAKALVVSRVGDDVLGREILKRLRGLGLRTDGVTVDASAPTGTVSVEVDTKGVPKFTIHKDVAWDRIEVTPAILEEAARADAVCFGSLAQRHETSRTAIRAVLDAAPKTALRVFDINLRQHFHSKDLIDESLRRSNVLKINDAELGVVAQCFGLSGDEGELMRQLALSYRLAAVALTKGAKGSTLLVGETMVTRPAGTVLVVDTVGAGDAYGAAMTLGLLAGHSPERILEQAHRLAEFVCTQAGATPPLPPDLRTMFGPA